MSVGQAASVLKRTRRYVGELARAGGLTVEGSGSKRLFLAAEVHRVGEIINNSVDLDRVLIEYDAKGLYGRFAEDDVVSQCVRKLGNDYFVRRENVDILLGRLRALDGGKVEKQGSNGTGVK